MSGRHRVRPKTMTDEDVLRLGYADGVAASAHDADAWARLRRGEHRVRGDLLRLYTPAFLIGFYASRECPKFGRRPLADAKRYYGERLKRALDAIEG